MPRDRDSLRHQLTDANQRMSEVSAAHDALQQEMMELTQEQQGNKASQQREWCPRGSGANASHRTVQAWMDSNEKNSQGRDPRTQEEAKEHSQLQAKEHTQPQGKE